MNNSQLVNRFFEEYAEHSASEDDFKNWSRKDLLDGIIVMNSEEPDASDMADAVFGYLHPASELGSIKSERKAKSSAENGKLGGRLSDSMVCYLKNPWSDHVSEMTWGEIKTWAHNNVHPVDVDNWMRYARKAARNCDADTLGKMIIGS